MTEVPGVYESVFVMYGVVSLGGSLFVLMPISSSAILASIRR